MRKRTELLRYIYCGQGSAHSNCPQFGLGLLEYQSSRAPLQYHLVISLIRSWVITYIYTITKPRRLSSHLGSLPRRVAQGVFGSFAESSARLEDILHQDPAERPLETRAVWGSTSIGCKRDGACWRCAPESTRHCDRVWATHRELQGEIDSSLQPPAKPCNECHRTSLTEFRLKMRKFTTDYVHWDGCKISRNKRPHSYPPVRNVRRPFHLGGSIAYLAETEAITARCFLRGKEHGTRGGHVDGFIQKVVHERALRRSEKKSKQHARTRASKA